MLHWFPHAHRQAGPELWTASVICPLVPATLFHGLIAHGVPAAAAAKVAGLPPTATVFAAFLGYNPIHTLLGPSGVLARLPHA